jgi:hypothetical protein
METTEMSDRRYVRMTFKRALPNRHEWRNTVSKKLDSHLELCGECSHAFGLLHIFSGDPG